MPFVANVSRTQGADMAASQLQSLDRPTFIGGWDYEAVWKVLRQSWPVSNGMFWYRCASIGYDSLYDGRLQ